MSHWERWLEFCARIDGFPRHLSIHSGGMLVTAAPLIDIAPIERATMVDRVVVQFDKRDVETLKLIKLDLLGLGMLAAMDETLQLIEHDCAVCLDLDRLPEDVPEVFEMLQAADTVGVFQVESRAQMQTLPKSRPQNLDDLVVEVAIIRPGPIQGNAVHPFLRRKQGLEPVTYLHPSLEPVLKDSMGVILYQEQVMRVAIEVAGFTPGRLRRVPAGDGDVALEPRDGEAPSPVRRRRDAAAGDGGGDRRGAVPPGRRVRELRVRQVACGGVRPDGLRIGLPQALLSRPVPRRARQRPADGLLPGRGPRQRREAPRRVRAARGHQRLLVQDHDRMGGATRRAAARGRGDRRPAGADPVTGLRRPERCRARALDAGAHGGLGRPPGPAPGQGDRRAARGAAGRGAGPRPVSIAGRCRGADRPARGDPRAAHPDRRPGFAGPAAARAAVAAPRGGGGRPRPRGRSGAAGPGAGGRQAWGGGRPAAGPAVARDRGAGPPAADRVGADRRRLRGDRAGRAAAGRRSCSGVPWIGWGR